MSRRAEGPKRVSWSRGWLERINKGLAFANVRIETLTAARAERVRLKALESFGGFGKAIFPVPESFASSDYRDVLDSLPSFRKRFDSFGNADANEVGFQLDNNYFGSPDAEVLYSMVRRFQPKRTLEIGCGNSTRIIRQAIKDGEASCHLTCIDPRPRVDVLPLADEFIRGPIEQQDAVQLAKSLNAGDLLFIDTSHEVKVANDVAFIYANLLPRIPSGVIVHIHDIFLPYEYPKEWVLDPQYNSWGEQYILQAYLSYASHWRVLWPGYYLQQTLPDFAAHFPHRRDGMAQSFWMQKR